MGLIEQCRKRFFILQRIKKYLNQDGWILNRTYDIINMIVSLNRVLYNVFWNEGFRLHVCTSLAFLDQLIKSDWKWKSGSKLYNNIKKSYIITYYDTLHVWKQQMKKYLSTKIRQKQWYGHVDKKSLATKMYKSPRRPSSTSMWPNSTSWRTWKYKNVKITSLTLISIC